MAGHLSLGPVFLQGTFHPIISATPSSVIPWNGFGEDLVPGTLRCLYQLEVWGKPHLQTSEAAGISGGGGVRH